jgi:hypothetical protein
LFLMELTWWIWFLLWWYELGIVSFGVSSGTRLCYFHSDDESYFEWTAT